MLTYYDRYQKGAYQEVYDELVDLQDRIYDPDIYKETLMVMREIMHRVRFNLEQIVQHLEKMGYQFRKGGFWETFSAEEKAHLNRDYPIFRSPSDDASLKVALLEQHTGSFPLSLKCWYEEVGSVNLIGLFPTHERGYGPVLDPLYIESFEMVRQIVTQFIEIGGWQEEPVLLLAPDNYHKYGYSGAGSYNITLPCKAVDALFLNEPHKTTLVNYLRIAIHWGGFPGLEQENRLTSKELAYLREGLLPF